MSTEGVMATHSTKKKAGETMSRISFWSVVCLLTLCSCGGEFDEAVDAGEQVGVQHFEPLASPELVAKVKP